MFTRTGQQKEINHLNVNFRCILLNLGKTFACNITQIFWDLFKCPSEINRSISFIYQILWYTLEGISKYKYHTSLSKEEISFLPWKRDKHPIKKFWKIFFCSYFKLSVDLFILQCISRTKECNKQCHDSLFISCFSFLLEEQPPFQLQNYNCSQNVLEPYNVLEQFGYFTTKTVMNVSYLTFVYELSDELSNDLRPTTSGISENCRTRWRLVPSV